jgi:hypothetical protein
MKPGFEPGFYWQMPKYSNDSALPAKNRIATVNRKNWSNKMSSPPSALIPRG